MNDFSYSDIINIDYKKNITMYLFTIAIVILLIISCLVTSFSIYTCEANVENDYLSITVLYTMVETIETADYIKISDVNYKYEIISCSEIFAVGEYYYQTINIKTEKVFLKNEILEIQILYNENKMINKIIDLIF